MSAYCILFYCLPGALVIKETNLQEQELMAL